MEDGTYVFFELTPDSKRKLAEFVNTNLKLTQSVDPASYHLTVIYSKSPVPEAYQLNELEIDLSALPKRFVTRRTKNYGKVLILELDSPEAVELNEFLSNLGARSDFRKYNPHITIVYDMMERISLKKVPVPEFPIEFERIIARPIPAFRR